MKNILILSIFFSLYTCKIKKSNNLTPDDLGAYDTIKKKEDVILNGGNYRQSFLKEAQKDINDSIKINVLSPVLLNPCLDIDNKWLARINSETYSSLRKSIVDSMKIETIIKILEHPLVDSLKTNCLKTMKGEYDYMPYYSKSYWELLNDRIKKE